MKTEYFESLNSLVTTGTLLLEIALLLSFLKLLLYIASPEFRSWGHRISGIDRRFVGTYMDKGIVFTVLVLAAVSSGMTLVYSEYFGLVPCALCWFGRIAMYPLVLIAGIALWKGEATQVLKYIAGFSIVGVLVSVYHHTLQMVAVYGGDKLPCPTSGGDCSQISVFGYGHITFPYMAMVIFVFFLYLILVGNIVKKYV
jgi:disulfide bond formation protein DsbB